MAKKCFSMKDESFDKILKKEFADKKKLQKIYNTISELENLENEYFNSGGKDRNKLNQFGKTLSKMGHKDTYCLEVGTDRFLAHIIEDEDVKIFAWYWGGSHDKYNNVLMNLPKPKSDIEKKIEEEKSNVVKNIQSIRKDTSFDRNLKSTRYK